MITVSKAVLGINTVFPGDTVSFNYTVPGDINTEPRSGVVEAIGITENENVILTCDTDHGYRNYRTDRMDNLRVKRSWKNLFRS